jgi:hypothetical protein
MASAKPWFLIRSSKLVDEKSFLVSLMQRW